MANSSSLPHSLMKFRTSKANLYFMAVTTALCSVFYLIGIWHQSRAPVAISSTAAITCTPNQEKSNTHFLKPLIFESRHPAVINTTAIETHAPHAPPCDPKYFEYTPCEDAERSLKFDRDRLIYRERHCPAENEVLKCRIPAPFGYRTPVRWPESRDSVWYANVPHKHLTVEKAVQNWVRFEGDRFNFPGGGTMFPRGADVYIDDIGKLINLADGSIRTAIDTGCGVASWGGYLISRGIIGMSFAPRDTHEAQVQFALERGIPALIGIIASKRLPYPSRSFDMAHCSRCLIPWANNEGQYLIEVDRILRPGGYWILSGPPINWENKWRGWDRTAEDLQAEQTMIENVAKSLCWKKIAQKEELAVWQKPTNHLHCKINRKIIKKPEFCQNQDPDTAWYTDLETCLTPLPEVSDIKEIAGGGPLAKWPERLTAVPPRIISGNLKGITAEDFENDTKLWKTRMARYKDLDYHLAEPGRYRNLLDMNSHLGGFAAALIDDPVWVMNVVPVEAQVNTLGVIYERGLIGTYQNWCEAMSTYPRTYDFIHADSIFTLYKDRCDIENILLEMDRILRPEGSVIMRDDVDVLVNVKTIVEGLEWDCKMVDSEGGPHHREKLLIAVKKYWTSPQLIDQNQD